MINQEQTIPCPVCSTKIPFDTRELLRGVKFICSGCNSAIGLAEESKPIVQVAMDKLDEIRNDVSISGAEI